MVKEQDMHTIRLPDSLAKEIHSVSQELGYAEEAQFVEDTLKEKVLECKRQLFAKGVTDIQRKIALRGFTEDEIVADFEQFRHSQGDSSAT